MVNKPVKVELPPKITSSAPVLLIVEPVVLNVLSVIFTLLWAAFTERKASAFVPYEPDPVTACLTVI